MPNGTNGTAITIPSTSYHNLTAALIRYKVPMFNSETTLLLPALSGPWEANLEDARVNYSSGYGNSKDDDHYIALDSDPDYVRKLLQTETALRSAMNPALAERIVIPVDIIRTCMLVMARI